MERGIVFYVFHFLNILLIIVLRFTIQKSFNNYFIINILQCKEKTRVTPYHFTFNKIRDISRTAAAN